MHHADIQAHTSMTTPRATIGRHALTPSTLPRRGIRWVRVILAVLAVAALAACGGGANDARGDVQCNPDTWDCASMYADFPFRAVPDDATGADIYTFNPAPRVGFTLVNN